jgi:hypothetical protein
MDELSEYKLLSKLSKKSSFDVPQGYFDRLPYDIQERCARKKSVWTELINSKAMIFKYAFGALLVFTGVLYYFRDKEQKIVQISSVELISYVEQDAINAMDEQMLTEELEEDQIEVKNLAGDQIEEQDIEEFLINEQITEAELINEMEV